MADKVEKYFKKYVPILVGIAVVLVLLNQVIGNIISVPMITFLSVIGTIVAAYVLEIHMKKK